MRNRVTSGYERKLIVSFVFNLVQNLGHPGKQSNRTQLYKMFFDWSKFYASIVSTTRMMAALNEQQVFAERIILEGHNVVLTGQAGTGKTFLLVHVFIVIVLVVLPVAHIIGINAINTILFYSKLIKRIVASRKNVSTKPLYMGGS